MATITAARSPLYYSKVAGGLPFISDASKFTGNIFYVDSAVGTDAAGYGTSPDAPFDTIDYAIGNCVANQGDVILVLPGHAESIAAAAGIDADVAGVSIIGLGSGNNRPTITFITATTADIDIDAANVTIKNLRFVGNIAALAAPIDVNAAGFTMEDCDFFVAAATTDIDITVITDAAAKQMTIRRCTFNYLYSNEATAVAVSATSTEVIRLVGADRSIIEDCYMSGNFTTSAINGITTLSADIKILRNGIVNVQTTNIAGIIDLVALCRGVIANNYGFHGYTTDLATTIDPSSCAMINNYFSNVVTEAGGLVGTPST